MDFIADNLGTIVTIVLAFGATYAAFSSRITKLETRIDDSDKLTRVQIEDLRADVEKHNNMIERTYALEGQTAVHEQRITASEARIKKLEGAA